MSSLKNSTNTPVNPDSRHILLLDDEVAVRDALARLLKLNGHQCTTASTGKEVLEIISSANQTNTSFDLAILDIKIFDGMGGIETVQKMKELGSAIPVISMSGYSKEEIFHSEGDGNEFSGHLQKPFDKLELLGEIQRLCPTSSGALQE